MMRESLCVHKHTNLSYLKEKKNNLSYFSFLSYLKTVMLLFLILQFFPIQAMLYIKKQQEAALKIQVQIIGQV